MSEHIKGWSYSAWSCLRSCPLKFQKIYLDKWPQPKGWALERGIQIHKIAEQYLRKQIGKLPKSLKFFRPHYRELLNEAPVVEQFWGIDKKFRQFVPNLRRGERSWCVMKMDAAVPPTKRNPTLFIQDLKTGNIYDGHVKQGGLYAAIGSVWYDTDGVDVEFWYADKNDVRSFHFTNKRLAELREIWTERGKDIMTPRKKYKPTPSKDACRYCPWKSSEGGGCEKWRDVM